MSFTFAAAPTSAAPATGGFSFTPAAPAAPATTGFTFGAATAPTTTTPAPPATTAGFGFGTAPSGTTGGFGFGSTGGFGFGTAATAAQPQMVPASAATAPQHQPLPSGAILPLGGYVRDLQDPVVKRINDISDSINPSSPNCLFQYVLYNLLPPNSPFRGRLTKPPHANEEVWRRGLAENPNPDKFVPCLVVGWPDLLIRLQEQQKALNTHISTMQYLANDATSTLINSQHNLHHQLDDSQQKQTILNSRILNLVSRIQAIRCGNMPLTDSEIEYKNRLDDLMNQLTSPGENLDQVQSLGELVTIQANLRDRERAQKLKHGPNKKGLENEEQKTQQNRSNSNTGGTSLSRLDALAAIDEDSINNRNGGNASNGRGIDQDDGSDFTDSDDDNDDSDDDDSDDDLDDDDYENSQPMTQQEEEHRRRLKRRLRRRNANPENSQSLKNSLAHLVSVVNDQSNMIKELVDEVSLCVTDLQVCEEALQGF